MPDKTKLLFNLQDKENNRKYIYSDINQKPLLFCKINFYSLDKKALPKKIPADIPDNSDKQ